MRLTPRTFLLLLRNLVLLFRKRWDQMARRLWYIFGVLRSQVLSRCLEKRDEIRPSVERRPAKSDPTTVICASQLPPLPLTIGEILFLTDRESPTTISIAVRQGTPEETIQDYHESHGSDYSDVRVPIPRSPDIARYYEEPDPIEDVLSLNRRDSTSNSSATTSPNNSRPPSRRSPRSVSPRASSPRPPPSTHSTHQLSTGSSVSPRVYSAPRPISPLQTPYPITDPPRRRSRSPVPASARWSVYEARPDSPELRQLVDQTTAPTHHDRNSGIASFGPSTTSSEGRLRPMIAIDRHERHRKVKIEHSGEHHVLPPATTEFVGEDVPGWAPLVHPEGALYWVNEQEFTYTDTDMRDLDLRRRIEEALGELKDLVENSPSLPVDDLELALELGQDEKTGEDICSYYFVYHSTRCLFWLHHFDPEDALGGLRGVTELTHIHLGLQAQYWTHWEMYPHDRLVPKILVKELLGILVHAGVDCMTSPNSTAPYSEAELNKLLGYVKHVTSLGGHYGFSACIVGESDIPYPISIFPLDLSGRLMYFFLNARYLNFHGQKGARLANDQTIYGYHHKRTYLIKTLSIILFYTPELYLRGLESAYTDFTIFSHRWARFITQALDEWKDIIINGTVLLTANMAFLAIPTVDTGTSTRTPTQFASYLSIVTSIGSIVIGLLLVQKNRKQPRDSQDDIDDYLRSRHNKAIGFETLAILYSLPYSLLVWSTVAFTTAFSLETLVFSRQTWTKLSLGIVFGTVILLIFWCVWTTIGAGTGFSGFGTFYRLKVRLVNLTTDLKGNILESRPDAGDGEGGGGNRSRISRGAFSFIRRRRRGSTFSTQVVGDDQAGGKGDPSDDTGSKLGKINAEQGSAV